MGGPGLRVLSSSHCHSFALSGDTLLYFWHGEVSLESIKKTRAAIAAAQDAYPNGFYVLAFISQGTRIPGADVRTESAAVDQACHQMIRAHATVIPGEGFWVATARSVLGAVFLLSRTAYPRKVFRDAPAALIWLRSVGGAHVYDPVLAHIRAQQQLSSTG
jgi:hypothetical protein